MHHKSIQTYFGSSYQNGRKITDNISQFLYTVYIWFVPSLVLIDEDGRAKLFQLSLHLTIILNAVEKFPSFSSGLKLALQGQTEFFHILVTS